MTIENLFLDIKEEYGDIVFITDDNIYKLYNYLFKDNKIIVIPPGEDNKDLNTVISIYDQLIEYEVSKNTMIVGVGGGIVTDITGFVATTYLRGVRFGFVSTTLLGIVDASIGGKNGVNFYNYKNIIGTIKKPEFIYWNIDFLKTLPERELHAGFGEILKYAIGFDKELFDILLKFSYNELINDKEAFYSVINRCIEIKKKIITQDLQEKNIRRKLNLGHTIAHAIEKHTHEIVHGEAVGIGLYVMAFYSGTENKIELPILSDILKLLKKYDLSYENKYDYKELLRDCIDNIKCDKKKTDSKTIDIVVITDYGKCDIESIDIDVFKKTLKEIFLY